MPSYVSLLRGINVSGHRKIRMTELKSLYEDLGFKDVRTYLQSGNVIFSGKGKPANHTTSIQTAIEATLGHEVSVLVITCEDFLEVAASNPFLSQSGIDPKFLHVTFLFQELSKGIPDSSIPKTENEGAILCGGHYYLNCPNGYGRTKINNTYFERKLNMVTTTRNWNTIIAINRLLET